MSKNIRFILHESDGMSCTQVLVYNEDDLNYLISECKKTNHLMALDYHVPKNAFANQDTAHDVYQIFPRGRAHLFAKLTPIEIS